MPDSQETVFRPAFPPADTVPAGLRELAAGAREHFESRGFPSRTDEDWRLTRLDPIVGTAFEPAPETGFDVTAFELPGVDAVALVNGRPAPEIAPQNLPDGVTLIDLATAAEQRSELIAPVLGSIARFESNAFVALNTAQHLGGYLLHLDAGIALDRPLHVISTTTGPGTAAYPRLLIVAGPGARATVVETHHGGAGTLSVPVTEIVVGEGASIAHVRTVECDGGSFIGTVAVRVDARGAYALSTAGLGGVLSRTDLRVSLMGEGADASLDGLMLTGGEEHGAIHVAVEHGVGNCTSSQRFRSVLDGKSTTDFTGRIVVAEDAQNTDARQSARALLRSREAVAHNNPQLEIYADDVRCTHGATVGRLDDEALFYLRARGIGLETARGLLTLAFAAEVLGNIPVETVRERLEERLARSLGPENLR